MAEYDNEGMRVVTPETRGVWGTCDECREEWWLEVAERDELDEPVSWRCSDGCDDSDEFEMDEEGW